MTDRIVKVLENNHLITRGISHINRRLYANQTSDESQPYTFDFTSWLGDDTIASVTSEGRGASITPVFDDTTVSATLSSFSGGGWIKLRITTAAGSTKELTIYTQQTNGGYADDYGECA